jgi:hypothetical protein
MGQTGREKTMMMEKEEEEIELMCIACMLRE